MYLYYIRGPPASLPIPKAKREATFRRFPSIAAPWQSGVMRRIYNPCERVCARSEGPNPSGAANIMVACVSMKKKIFVEKGKFDSVLSALLKSKPIERSKIKTSGKRGPKTALFQKP